jgi:hypothetical protein
MNGWISLPLVLAAMLVARWSYLFFFSKHGQFWRLVADRPDIALVVFEDHPYSVLDKQPNEPSKYAGPFSSWIRAGRNIGSLSPLNTSRGCRLNAPAPYEAQRFCGIWHKTKWAGPKPKRDHLLHNSKSGRKRSAPIGANRFPSCHNKGRQLRRP